MSATTMTKQSFRAGWAAIALAGLMVLAACGDDSDDTGGSGTNGNCTFAYECAGGGCECTTSGKDGTACCHPDDCGSDSNNCEAVCEVCS